MGGTTFLTTLFLGRDEALRRRSLRIARRISHLSDRRILAETYIPAVAALGGRILWVGCQSYTVDYYAPLEAQGGEVWTMDIVEEASIWGHGARHRTGDVCNAHQIFSELKFDAVICNGVLGYGANTVDQQTGALRALAEVLKPDGLLLLGWNTDKIKDPISAKLAEPWFKPAPFAGLPARVPCPGVTHVYDSLRRL